MPDSYRDIADSVGLLGYWSANDLYEESDYVRCTCTDAARAINEMRERLSAYEDAEEQGRLVILPCTVGDMVYYRRGSYVIGDTVRKIALDEFGTHVVLDCQHKEFDFEDFGKTAFTSREEADAALKGETEDV